MPPKKKVSKSSAKGKKTTGKKEKVDEVSPEQQKLENERKELCREADTISKLSSKEDHDFNEFQQQREKLNYFWIVEQRNVDDKKAILRNKERESQDLEEKHLAEIKVHKHKVKHILYEQQDSISRDKIDAEIALKMLQDDNLSSEAELKQDMSIMKQQLREMQNSHNDCLLTLQLDLDSKVVQMRDEFEIKASETNRNFERQMKVIRLGLETATKADTTAIEERKQLQVRELIGTHERSLIDIKAYYSNITHNNFELIKSLKEKVTEMKRKEQAEDRNINILSQKMKKIREPLRLALDQVQKMKADMELYNIEKADLSRVQANMRECELEREKLRWDIEILMQRKEIVTMDYKNIHKKLEDATRELRRRAGFRNIILEQKLAVLEDENQFRGACLQEIVTRNPQQDADPGNLNKNADEILAEKEEAAEKILVEIERVKKIRQSLIEKVEESLKLGQIPKEELGFIPKIDRHVDIRVI